MAQVARLNLTEEPALEEIDDLEVEQTAAMIDNPPDDSDVAAQASEPAAPADSIEEQPTWEQRFDQLSAKIDRRLDEHERRLKGRRPHPRPVVVKPPEPPALPEPEPESSPEPEPPRRRSRRRTIRLF